MKISSLEYSLVDALKSLRRNRSLSLASAATVAATLFILGVFILLSVNVNLAIKGVESQLQVKIALKDDITSDQQNSIYNALKNTNGVTDVSLETKSQALENFKQQLGDKNQEILQGLEKTNPLPNSYVVKVDKPDYISNVVSNVKGMDGIEDIQDGRDIVNQVMAITRTIKWVGGFVFVVLIAVSLFLINNTIRLTVYSRRREIGIMKYIGATDWFIRIPFILEGVIIGIVGAIISNIVLYYAYKFICSKATSTFAFIQLMAPSYVWSTTLWEFILVGMFIGGLGSVISVRKFLSV